MLAVLNCADSSAVCSVLPFSSSVNPMSEYRAAEDANGSLSPTEDIDEEALMAEVETQAMLAGQDMKQGGFYLPQRPDATVIESCRNMSLRQILEVDQTVVEAGMDEFFGNRLEQAERMFAAHEGADPLAANSKAVIFAGRGILSMEQVYITQASAYLLFASHFAQATIPPKKSVLTSAFSGVAGWLRKSPAATEASDTRMSPATFRSHVVTGEAEVLRGMVLLLEETFSSYLKAGLALRRAYNIYAMLQDHLSQTLKSVTPPNAAANSQSKRLTFTIPKRGSKTEDVTFTLLPSELLGPEASWEAAKKLSDEKSAAIGSVPIPISVFRYGIVVDDNSYFAMHFGLGCIHVATSVLPPKVLGILKTLGYMHDRTKGFHHLENCLLSNTIRSPLASLFLLGFNGTLPSFAVLMIDKCLPAAVTTYHNTLRCTKTVEDTTGSSGATIVVQKYKDSMIHVWLAGRVQRLKAASLDAQLYGDSMLACLEASSLSPTAECDIAIFRRCLEAGKKANLDKYLPQLKHFAVYDLAWSYCAAFEWLEAARCFNVLEREGGWSKGFYAYAQGCCYETFAESVDGVSFPDALTFTTTGDAGLDKIVGVTAAGMATEEAALHTRRSVRDFFLSVASGCYWRALSHRPTKLGGKIVTVDQFVQRRGKRVFTLGTLAHAADPTIAPHFMSETKLSKVEEFNIWLGGVIVPQEGVHTYANSFLLRNTTLGCAAVEMCLLFNLIPQTRVVHKHLAEGVTFSPLLRFKCLLEQRGLLHQGFQKAESHPSPRKVNPSEFVIATATDDSPEAGPRHFSVAFTALNEHIREDKAALVLVYGVVCREFLRARALVHTLGYVNGVHGGGGQESSLKENDVSLLRGALESSGWKGLGGALGTRRSYQETLSTVGSLVSELQHHVRASLFDSALTGKSSITRVQSSEFKPNPSSAVEGDTSTSPHLAILHPSAFLEKSFGYDISTTSLPALLKEELWLLPHAHYELRAVLDYYSYAIIHSLPVPQDPETITKNKLQITMATSIATEYFTRSKEVLTSRFGGKFHGADYNFEMTMEFRLHLCNDAFSHIQ